MSVSSEISSEAMRPVGGWALTLCRLQVLAVLVAAILAYWEVETILGPCPVMAIIGWVLTRLVLQNNSLALVLYGLSCPLLTSVIAFLIAIFEWSPNEAATPVALLLTIQLVITTIWYGWLVLRVRRAVFLTPPWRRVEFQFSLLRLLIVMTVICILAAVLGNVKGPPERILFTLYGVLALMISVAMWVLFEFRVRKNRRECA